MIEMSVLSVLSKGDAKQFLTMIQLQMNLYKRLVMSIVCETSFALRMVVKNRFV